MIAIFIFFGTITIALAAVKCTPYSPENSPYTHFFNWTFDIPENGKPVACRTPAIGLPSGAKYSAWVNLYEGSQPVIVRIMMEPANPGPPVQLYQFCPKIGHNQWPAYKENNKQLYGSYTAYLTGRYYLEVISCPDNSGYHSSGIAGLLAYPK